MVTVDQGRDVRTGRRWHLGQFDAQLRELFRDCHVQPSCLGRLKYATSP